ncbi:DUF1801 domain-containing protein [Dyadobacter diqingensis]|uniref:DUF1801 domain-containing protein n=1 Tax=Dyadobacter diqingensis TaxID=2938121 RepID=UPI0020C36C67|nr:DUF1801 domain-containing protein [Dyadobacter diqingensis]
MAKNKTTETENSVDAYLQAIPDEKKRKDCTFIVDLIHQETGLKPKMWGTGIVGFGSYHYKYDSGHEGDAPLIGLAARVNAITLYISTEFEDRQELLAKFGKYKMSKACIYIKKIEDIDIEILRKMINNSLAYMRSNYLN